jgi:hypothetical protein
MRSRAMVPPAGNQVQTALQAVRAFGNIQGAILGPDRQLLVRIPSLLKIMTLRKAGLSI